MGLCKSRLRERAIHGGIADDRLKQDYKGIPSDLTFDNAQTVWNSLEDGSTSVLTSNLRDAPPLIRELFATNCVLYSPHNRFEDPAWLNEENLKSQAQHLNIKHMEGYSSRKLINYSPLRDNQDWLFGVVYDQTAFEKRIVPTQVQRNNQLMNVQMWEGFSGRATNVYRIAMQVVRHIMRNYGEIDLTIGGRTNRSLGLRSDEEVLVRNIFQLSSGETSLLNLFLSILRDFDLSGASLPKRATFVELS